MSDLLPLARCVAGVLLLGFSQPALAQAPAAKAEPAQKAPSADELLRRVDRQANAFNDATFHFRMRIKEPGGQVREIEFTTLQKGTQKRLVRFLSPGDIKGMGILMESADTMYALLPAFGNRVRRMGTHAKNQSFFGSDLSTEDMAAVEFAPDYSAKLAGTEGELTILELTLRPGKQAEFPRLRMWVDPARYTVTKIEYMDQAGKKLRTQLRTEFKLDEGSEHYSPGKLVFIDHRRNNHETELILLSSKVNTGLGDDQFTVRALQRN